MRNAEWPCHVSFIGIISLVICLSAGNVSYLPSLFHCTFHQLGLLTLQRCLRIRALGSPLGSCRAIRIMTGGIPELLCRSPSSGVDLNQDFSRLRFRYGTCYRLKVQLVYKLHCFHFISGIALLLEFAVSITRSVHAIEVSVVS